MNLQEAREVSYQWDCKARDFTKEELGDALRAAMAEVERLSSGVELEENIVLTAEIDKLKAEVERLTAEQERLLQELYNRGWEGMP